MDEASHGKEDAQRVLFDELIKLLGEPDCQPADYKLPLHPSANYDGRHAAGLTPPINIEPTDVGLDDKVTKEVKVYASRPYKPGDDQIGYRLGRSPNIKSERPETMHVVLEGSYRDEKRGVVTVSRVLRDDGVMETWEKWTVWEQEGGTSGNTTHSKRIEDFDNNVDLWGRVLEAVKSEKRSSD